MSDTTTGSSEDRGRHADRPSDVPAEGWKDIAMRVKNEVTDDHTVLAAAGVAFFGFLALVPALAAVVSIAGLVTSAATIESRAEELFGSLPEDASQLLTNQLESIASSSSSSLSFAFATSLFLSLWSASGGMGHLIEAINVSYDEDDDRGFVRRKAIALAFTLAAVAFVVFAVVGLTALPSILDGVGVTGALSTVLQIAFWPLVAVLFAGFLGALYRFGPDRDEPEWRWVSWGSVVAVVLWIVASIGFRIYTANFGSYNESYGSLAAVVVLLLWLFITAFTVLLGALVNSEMEHQTVTDTTEGPTEPIGERDAVVADTVGESADELDDDDEADADGSADHDRRARADMS